MVEATRPRAENGVLFLGPWEDAPRQLVAERWPFARVAQLAEGLVRIDTSASKRGSCPGFNDFDGIAALSRVAPDAVAIGFFCDGVTGSEGVRIYENGAQKQRAKERWAEPRLPDPILWPISRLALSLRLPVEAVTRVERPGRPPVSVAIEALLKGEDAETPELRHQALAALGELDGVEAVTTALVRHLSHEDWVSRFHAARSYARRLRGQGQEGRPPLEALLDDADEGVREAALEGICDLLPEVAFSDFELQRQIDRAVERALTDEDEDVQAAGERARELRRSLLG